MVHDGVEQRRAPAISGQDALIEALAKNATAAKNTITAKPPHQGREFYPSSTERKNLLAFAYGGFAHAGYGPAIRQSG